MITLITGGPGMGKTALAVKMLVDQYSTRPIFTNIRGLTLPHSPLPLLAEWTHQETTTAGTVEHRFSFPAGAVLLIDECQSIYPPRSNGSHVPPHVAALATHRHTGIDIILITQGSGLIDAFARFQVKGGLHIFLRSSFLGRYRYERTERINEDDKTELSLCSKRKYKLPKEVFNLYKSAELHTKPPRAKLPLAFFLLFLAAAIGSGLAYKASTRISSAVNPDNEKPLASETAPWAAQPTTGAVTEASAVPASLILAMMPTDAFNPLSAPLYADVLPPVVPPAVIGCIASSRFCTCYTQQQTKLMIPETQCRARVAGRYYDPYAQITPPQDLMSFQTPKKPAIESDSQLDPETPS